jgi:hypothetical protein
MTLIYPESTPSFGNTKVKAVATIASDAAPSLATEVNAVSSLDVSCFIRDWNPEITSNSGTAPPRLCTKTSMPQEGTSQFSAVELRYVYDPQAADSTDENKAKALFVQGTTHKFVVRKGLDAQSTAFAASQRVEVWEMRAGRQNKVRSGDDEFAEFEISQMFYPIEAPTDGVIAA